MNRPDSYAGENLKGYKKNATSWQNNGKVYNGICDCSLDYGLL